MLLGLFRQKSFVTLARAVDDFAGRVKLDGAALKSTIGQQNAVALAHAGKQI
jgi:hypothetical protein